MGKVVTFHKKVFYVSYNHKTGRMFFNKTEVQVEILCFFECLHA